MKIAVVNNCAPFVTGGAEHLASALRTKLIEHGHQAINVDIPFQWNPPQAILESMLAARLLSLVNVDLMIGLKFPAYYLPHPNKTLWLLHQFRQVYDLWGTPFQDLPSNEEGERIRKAVFAADNLYLREAKQIYTISPVTAGRLRHFNSLDAEVLYHPLADTSLLHNSGYGDYVFCPSRITRGKRQFLLVEAARFLRSQTRVVIAGPPETPEDRDTLLEAVEKHGLASRVTIIAEFIPEQEKAKYLAGALACVYIPWDEDSYGYVSLEACHCRKPLITCSDSGGTTLLALDRVTGRVVPPEAPALAAAIDELAANRQLASDWGHAAFDHMMRLGIHWDHVIQRLTA